MLISYTMYLFQVVCSLDDRLKWYTDVKVKVEIDLKKNWKALDTDYIQKTGDVST